MRGIEVTLAGPALDAKPQAFPERRLKCVEALSVIREEQVQRLDTSRQRANVCLRFLERSDANVIYGTTSNPQVTG